MSGDIVITSITPEKFVYFIIYESFWHVKGRGMKIFAQRVKALRIEKGKKQREMAEYLGSGLRTYQYYESATHYPEIPDLIKLADFFDVSIDYLLGRTDHRERV